MKKFVRQKSGIAPTVEINLDFGAAAARVAHVFEPDDYKLRIETARVVHNGQNVHVALDLVMAESGDRIDNRPLWIDGPNASVVPFAAENQHMLAQLLALAGQPTSGDVNAIIAKLTGLEFEGYIILKRDSNGRAFNALATVHQDDAP